MAKVFLLTGVRKGKSLTIRDRYMFVDGACVVENDDDAIKMKPILCDFYACMMVSLEEYSAALQRQTKTQVEGQLED